MKIQNKKYVIPAKAGIQQVVEYYMYHKSLDSRFRGNDVYVGQQWVKSYILHSIVLTSWLITEVTCVYCKVSIALFVFLCVLRASARKQNVKPPALIQK